MDHSRVSLDMDREELGNVALSYTMQDGVCTNIPDELLRR